jgi:glycosyltransferase involved in cell wall biosynthesis
MSRKNPKVVIVMPAYFAEKTVEKTFRDIPRDLKVKRNIVLVDDAGKGRDRTAEIAQKLGLNVFIHPQNLGYGGNQKTCYKQALKLKPDIVVMIHPDYQYDSSMTKELIRPIVDGWLDLMLGNRIRTRKEALENGMPLYKYLGNRFLTIVENICLGQNLGEYHTGFRAYTREVLETVPFKKFSNDFVFDQEMLVSAIYSGFRIGQIPVPVRYFAEASSINFKRSARYGMMTLITLFKYYADRLGVWSFPIFNQKKKA